MKKTPVAVIGFVRPDLLRTTISQMAEAYEVLDRDIYVYLSSPRNDMEKTKTDSVLSLVESFRKTVLPNIVIIRREKNEGAGKNIRFAVTETLKKTGRAVIIEEDVLVSRTFFQYMDDALEKFENDKSIWCVNGFTSPFLRYPPSYREDTYLTPRNAAWGWGTWIDRWEAVDFDLKSWPGFMADSVLLERLSNAAVDLPGMVKNQYEGNIDTWDVQCTYHMVCNSLYAVAPRLSLTKNIGFHVEGSVHCCGSNAVYERQRYFNFSPRIDVSIGPSADVLRRIRVAGLNHGIVSRIVNKLVRYLCGFKSYNLKPSECK